MKAVINCTICLEDINRRVTNTLRCSHIFHKKCINFWLKDSGNCPLCRDIQINETTLKHAIYKHDRSLIDRCFILVTRKTYSEYFRLAVDYKHSYFIMICLKHGFHPQEEQLEYAAVHGYVEFYRYYIEHCKFKPTLRILNFSVDSENTELFRLLLNYVKPDLRTMYASVTNLNLEVFKACVDNNTGITPNIEDFLIKRNIIDFIEYYFEYTELNSSTLCLAIKYNRDYIIQKCLDDQMLFTNEIIDQASISNYPYIVENCLKVGIRIPPYSIINNVIRYNYISIIQLYIEYGYQATKKDLQNAIELNCIGIVILILQNTKFKITKKLMNVAISQGNEEIVRILEVQNTDKFNADRSLPAAIRSRLSPGN